MHTCQPRNTGKNRRATVTEYPFRMRSFIAHQGGWDEILLFLAPIAVAFVAVRALERRARVRRADVDSPTESTSDLEPTEQSNGTS